MPPRQSRPLPSILLMTDERMGDALWSTLERLPRGAGVVFRHYTLPPAQRRAVYNRARAVARRRGLLLLLAGDARQAAAWKADGVHGRASPRRAGRPLLRSTPVHSRKEMVAARMADLRLVSPVFATRSHPDARALGPVRLGLLLGGERAGVVALGGMTPRRARSLRAWGIDRWAAIDALIRT